MNAPVIVFVDNSSSVLSALKRMLRLSHRDWEMHFFSDPVQALEQLADLLPWVIVADRCLQEMDGIDFLQQAAVVSPQSVRVLFSGDAKVESALKATAAAHMVMRKPFEREVIDDLLTRARVLHQLPLSEKARASLGLLDNMPVLPGIYQQITQALEKDEPDVAEVAGLIRHDQVLLSRVLQLVNSPFFGFTTRTHDVDVAVMRLGLQTIHNLVLIIELYQPGQGSNGDTGSRLMREALLLAEQVGVLCDGRGVSKAVRNLAVISALLHNIGQLVHVGGAREYPLVGAYLLELWGFESEVIEAVQHQLDDDLPDDCDAAVELLNTALKMQHGHSAASQEDDA